MANLAENTHIDTVIEMVRTADNEADRLMAIRTATRWIESALASVLSRANDLSSALTRPD